MEDKTKLETYRGAVATWECDSNGHMNVMYYINKYELAGRQFFGQVGIQKNLLKGENLGVAVVEQNIKYLQEVFEDDLLHIKSHVQNFTEKVMVIQHELYLTNTNQKVSEATVKLLLFDKTKRKAIKIPPLVKANLEKLV